MKKKWNATIKTTLSEITTAVNISSRALSGSSSWFYFFHTNSNPTKTKNEKCVWKIDEKKWKRNKWPVTSGQRDDNSKTLHARFQDFFWHTVHCKLCNTHSAERREKLGKKINTSIHPTTTTATTTRGLDIAQRKIYKLQLLLWQWLVPCAVGNFFFPYFSWSKLCLNRLYYTQFCRCRYCTCKIHGNDQLHTSHTH